MPDIGMADFQMTRQRRVIAACEKWRPLAGPHGKANFADCSGFVVSVARELEITLHGQANDITEEFFKRPCIWTRSVLPS